MGLEPRVAGWKTQTNPLSYCGTPIVKVCFVVRHIDMCVNSNCEALPIIILGND